LDVVDIRQTGYYGRCPLMRSGSWPARRIKGRSGRSMKHVKARPYADPAAAARTLLELAGSIQAINGRIHIEKINAPFLYTLKANGPEFGAGIKYAIDNGWLDLHESGTYVRLLTSPEKLLPG
jgi:hypothetical protein